MPSHNQKKSTLTNVGNILNSIVSKLGLDRRLREKALLNLWPIIVGDTFVQNTRPLFVDYENNLVVAVQNASVAQELSFLKQQLTKKLQIAGRSTGLKVKGLRFDLKQFHTAEIENDGTFASFSKHPLNSTQSCRLSLNMPDEKTLSELPLSEDEMVPIAQLRAQIMLHGEMLPDHPAENNIGVLSERICRIVERELRLKKWLLINGSPVCRICGVPAPQLHTKAALCAYCYLQQQNTDLP